MNSIILQDIEDVYSRNIDWEQFREKTILVTGPNGMLASYVMYMLIYLNEVQHFHIHIIAMVRSIEKFNARFNEYKASDYISVITEPIVEPIKISEKIDYIIHAASLASPQYYDVCPVDVLSPNVLGTYYLLKLAVEKRIKGFLMFSTGDVYGKVEGVDSVRENNMGVIDPLDIHSCYSESKRMAETICNSFMHQYGVPIRIVRIWHTYAPTMNVRKDPRVFASFMKNILEGQNIEIKSDGSGKRAFCYIADALAGFFMVLTRGIDGEAYNICNSEQFISIRKLAETLVTLRKDVNIKATWKQRAVDEHYTENTAIGAVAPSDEKLRSLGWQPRYSVSEGFMRVLDYQMMMQEK